ncbi:hypothetical protein [Herbaspirillum sp. CAH-3]|uniref:hypothetical protein n=1 Tax=Herbaspirillum sp. CAH-3 TaxID=2605746 RepID=UPI0012AC9018|nr:hypothetical protein [Herbaspirillum sp. CAH-3]MRT30838.1 hypothetical protein [Herbaspirillum sp. CAH-3]
MIMTTEELAELKRKVHDATPGNVYCGDKDHLRLIEEAYAKAFKDACTPEVVSSLIALAERALQPEEGQALPKPEEDAFMADVKKLAASVLGDCYLGKLDEEELAAKVKKAASQLALPAGPVPVQGKFFLLDPAGYSHPEIFNTEEERDAAAKDAIMDHLSDGWSEEVENIVCGVITHEATKVDVRHRPAEGTPEYDDWPDHSFDEICNYEMRPVASPAVAQPVADERVRAYAIYRIREDENDGKEFFHYAMWHDDQRPGDGERMVPGYFVPDRAALGQPAEEGGKS